MEQFPREVLCDWASATPEVVVLCVFGSRARGTARPDFDLDLPVQVDGGSFGRLGTISGPPLSDTLMLPPRRAAPSTATTWVW